MYKCLIGILFLSLTACKTTEKPTEVVVSDEVFFENCLAETNKDIKVCKQRLVKRRIGFECKKSRKNHTSTRIKKETCTTASQRKRIQERSDQFIEDMQRSRGVVPAKSN